MFGMRNRAVDYMPAVEPYFAMAVFTTNEVITVCNCIGNAFCFPGSFVFTLCDELSKRYFTFVNRFALGCHHRPLTYVNFEIGETGSILVWTK